MTKKPTKPETPAAPVKVNAAPAPVTISSPVRELPFSQELHAFLNEKFAPVVEEIESHTDFSDLYGITRSILGEIHHWEMLKKSVWAVTDQNPKIIQARNELARLYEEVNQTRIVNGITVRKLPSNHPQVKRYDELREQVATADSEAIAFCDAQIEKRWAQINDDPRLLAIAVEERAFLQANQ